MNFIFEKGCNKQGKTIVSFKKQGVAFCVDTVSANGTTYLLFLTAKHCINPHDDNTFKLKVLAHKQPLLHTTIILEIKDAIIPPNKNK